jgi:hypothetical protein
VDEPKRDASQPEAPGELDGRFPSGPWTGFYLERCHPGRQWMELRLSFRNGRIRGEGRDRIGAFTFIGTYGVRDGRCLWLKRYIGRHEVAYQGDNEGKGIWGVWEIPPSLRGGFHIWPVGMGDPTVQAQAEEAGEAIAAERELAVPATAGTGRAPAPRSRSSRGRGPG